MMTHAATAPDPLAAATAIAEQARRRADRERSGTAAVAALATGVIFSLAAIAAMVSSPAVIPVWCAAHGGCP
jgi:fatty acid desaturase